MWIRSQNKEILANCKNLICHKEENSYKIMDYGDDKFCTTLGSYKTKERAIEVLNEIQKTIYEYGVSMDFEGTQGTIHSLNVFQMPEK